MKATTIRLPKLLHERVRIHALRSNSTLERVVAAAIEEYLAREEE